MSLTVTIPVTLGGYTGQRDQWQEYERPYAVTVEEGLVTLANRGTDGRKITFSKEDLAEAIKFYEEHV